MPSLSFDHMDSTRFEEFCFRLLVQLGFDNVRWRKGTGHNASPADRGRDIECERRRTDLDGRVVVETWFVECKHHKKGVPPAAIGGLLAWASAKSANVALVITSGFLSNAAVDFLEDYRATNKPRFDVRDWQLPTLEDLTSSMFDLRKEFGLITELEYVGRLHPIHLEFIARPAHLDLAVFLTAAGEADVSKRDKLFLETYHRFIPSTYREPETGEETFAQLREGPPLEWDTFVSHLRTAAREVDPEVLVRGILAQVLADTFFLADPTKTAEAKRNIDAILKQKEMPFLVEHRNRLDDRTVEYQELYRWLCESVVGPVLAESEVVALENARTQVASWRQRQVEEASSSA